jgi:hypothetical protein
MDPERAADFAAQVAEWKATLHCCRIKMSEASIVGFAAAEDMIFDNIDPKSVRPLKRALRALSVELGKSTE